MKIKIIEYLDERGRSPFQKWFDGLPAQAAAKVAAALYRLEQGNDSNVKSLGGGVYEYKIYHGPGYRIYFARSGKALLILLAGGTKKRQSDDIKLAKARWQSCKALEDMP